MPDIRTIIPDLFSLPLASILDCGCGSLPVSLSIPAKFRVGIDVDLHGLESARKHGDRIFVMNLNMMSIGDVFLPHSFSLALFTDSLEHIPFIDAKHVIATAKNIATTVVAFIPEGSTGDNPWDAGYFKHKHHWSEQDCRDAGFDTVDRYPNYHGESQGAFLATYGLM